MKFVFDWKKYAETARHAVSEGCVLLLNEDKTLPIKKGDTVSIFGRIQFDYYKSGTGSGGMVNAPYVVSILDALKEHSDITINEDLLYTYENWIKEHPFNKGKGWASEPWCQEEMEVPEELAIKAARQSDLALVIIGRSAGEDQDNSVTRGSYLLTEKEESMIANVCKSFKRVAVVLNVGNVIDMSFVTKYHPQAVLYAWQGGMEGGHGVVDVLTGAVSPSGKLSDTIAYDINDYPSTKDFGDEVRNYYREDIYVGYRYFETAAKDSVQYPFGFGLSYTQFTYTLKNFCTDNKNVNVIMTVKNIGDVAGKEVIQIYNCPPQGALCKPTRNLCGFAKTRELNPGETEDVSISFDVAQMASFDDSGVTGHAFSFILEKGRYDIFAGNSIRNTILAGSVDLSEDIVTQELEEACAPVLAYNRLKIEIKEDGTVKECTEAVPLRRIDLKKRIKENRMVNAPFTGNMGYTFKDVMEGKVSNQDYLAQLDDEDLICMSRGEGMCSAKVTPGIAGSFGGVTRSLQSYGMPIAGCADGPSGIRMDCGTKAFSQPNGTLLACSFNTDLTEKLYEWEGMELRKNKIDTLLGPGINIHRNPLNGRNFEYFSEDPYLTGVMAVAMLKGMSKYGVTGTIKHFAGNNQELQRHNADSVISQRALREIYLKAFEMAVKEGNAYSIMTTYGPINGIWTAGNYDLNTTILRNEWGYRGLVMTDWWAKVNEEGGLEASIYQTSFMIRAQNDVYMVVGDSAGNTIGDDSLEGLRKGVITRAELLRNAENILYVLKKSPVGIRVLEGDDDVIELNRPMMEEKTKNIMKPANIDGLVTLDLEGLDTNAGSDNQFSLHIPLRGFYELTFKMKSDLGELAQISMSISTNNMLVDTITINGTNGEWITRKTNIEVFVSVDNYVDLYFAQSGIQIDKITVAPKKQSQHEVKHG